MSCGFIIFSVGSIIYWFSNNCSDLSQGSCQLLVGSAIVSVLGGTILTEILIAYRKAQGKWHQVRSSPKDGPVMTSKQNWFRAIGWVVLSGLAAGLPIIVKGAIIIAVFAPITGLFLSALVRTFTNRLPPSVKDD